MEGSERKEVQAQIEPRERDSQRVIHLLAV